MDWGWSNKRPGDEVAAPPSPSSRARANGGGGGAAGGVASPGVRRRGRPRPTDMELSQEESSLLVDIIGQLSSSGTLREREEKKEELRERLSKLNGRVVQLVDDHHDSFLKALRALFTVIDSIDDAKARVQVLRSALISCKTLLQCKRDHIRQLWIESAEYKEMIRLFDKIEEVKQVPEKIDGFMATKHHVHAARLLVDTLHVLETEALRPVTALHDIYRNLGKRKEAMHGVLVAELHSQLYGKPREMLPAAGSAELAAAIKEEEDVDIPPDKHASSYLIFTIRALSTLRKVTETVATVRHRMPSELALIVDQSVAYAEDHYMPKQAALADLQLVQSLAFDKTNSGPRVLFRLLTDIYDRLLGVLRGHICVLECLRATPAGRRVLGDPGAYDEHDVWQAIQSEIEHVLGQYLDQHDMVAASSSVDDDTHASPLRSAKKRSLAKAKLFSFANSENAIAETSVNIERALRQQPHSSHVKSTTAFADKYTSGVVSQQKLICKRTVFNITGMFKPTIFFTEEVEAIIAPGEDQALPECFLRQFVEIYVRDKFLPRVREDLRAQLKATADAPDRPSEMSQGDGGGSMILQSAWTVHGLVGRLCGLMMDVPQYSSEFVAMIHSLLEQYWGICQNRFTEHVRSRHKRPSELRRGSSVLSAEWQADDRVNQAVRRDFAWQEMMPPSNEAAFRDLLEESVYPLLEEPELLVELLGNEVLDKSDVVLETTTFKALANLHESLCWLAGEIVTVADMIETRPGLLAQYWSDVGPIVDVVDDMAILEIERHITPRKTAGLRTLSSELTKLAESCLITLRLELRTHCFFYLLPAIRKTNYDCDIDGVETDPLVVSLNKDLAAIDEALASNLHPDKLAYLFNGLGHVIANLLIKSVRHIKRKNKHGVKRMCRNVFALQQSLTNITKTRAADMDRALQYYELLYLESEDVLQGVVANGAVFTEEEYRATLNLISASRKVPDPERHAQNIQDLGAAFHELV